MLKYALITLTAATVVSGLLVGCGTETTVTSSSVVTPKLPSSAKTRVALLPFSDYSAGWTKEGYWRRNSALHESIEDALSARGYVVAADEDVTDYLVDNGIIRVTNRSTKFAPKQDITKSFGAFRWDKPVSKNQRKYHEADRRSDSVALTAAQIRRIGEKFNVDYIIRGRILEYTFEDTQSYDPLKVGAVPFLVNGVSGAVFGTASTSSFDTVNDVTAGVGIGWVAAELFSASTDTWSALGAGLAFLGSNSGRTDLAVLNVRLTVQDARTGEIVWTNRAEAETRKASVFSSDTERQIFRTAIMTVVDELFYDLDRVMMNRHATRQQSRRTNRQVPTSLFQPGASVPTRPTTLQTTNTQTASDGSLVYLPSRKVQPRAAKNNNLPVKDYDLPAFTIPHTLRDGYNSFHQPDATIGAEEFSTTASLMPEDLVIPGKDKNTAKAPITPGVQLEVATPGSVPNFEVDHVNPDDMSSFQLPTM